MMTIPTPAAARPAADAFHQQLAAYRDLVAPVVRGAVPDREPRRYLYDLIDGLLARDGKGLRPALCLATCGALGGDTAKAVPSAAAIELMHNAFLVHDDVEDGSEFRRDQPTMHRQFGLPLAVNAGDAMQAMSARLLRRNLTGLPPATAARIFEEFDHLVFETLEGQAMELGWIRDNDCDVSEDDYLLMVLKKTSWYSFIHPPRIGALVARPDLTDLEPFNRLGLFLGAAFQIQDDILNLVGDRRIYGKEIGGDLVEGKRTLVLAHLLRRIAPDERRRLQQFLAKPRPQRLPREVAWIYDLLGRYGSIEYARRAARQFAEAAQRELQTAYAGAVPGPDLDFIQSLVGYVVNRQA